MAKKEVWKDIPGYEDIYQASTHGRIRTTEGKTTHSVLHGVRVWKSRVLKYKGYTPKTGYRVTLWKNKKPKDWLVARLVALTFLGVPDQKLTVNHINGNRMDNRIENIEWLTLADNIRHAFDTGLMPANIKTKLVDNKGKEKTFRSMSLASEWLGHSAGYISACKQGGRNVRDRTGNIYRCETFK